MIPETESADYTYHLPPDLIASHPTPERDACRLLVCSTGTGSISHRLFVDLVDYLGAGDTLVVNSTRVVRARILLQRTTGGRIEVFLLEPLHPSRDPSVNLAARGSVEWSCLVGGGRKFLREPLLERSFNDGSRSGLLRVSLVERLPEGFRLRFDWTPSDLSFADVLELLGDVPLPPYIDRAATTEDARHYQTVYADQAGAVAAPTAGLHFTQGLLGRLHAQGVEQLAVNLHVGAGTFRPIKGAIAEHDMHKELISVSGESLRHLRRAAERREDGKGRLVLVGTTSLRAVESIYWLGVRLIRGESISDGLLVAQWDPYRLAAGPLPDLSTALAAVEEWCGREGLDGVVGTTGIMIVPGYRFAACDALITNFHQPGSTLLLLVGALMGEFWKHSYTEAIKERYRFLSYGDAMLVFSSLLSPPDTPP